MIRVRRLGHIALNVRDLQGAIEFYTRVLGLEVADHVEEPLAPEILDAAFLRCGTDHHCLALFQTPEGSVDPVAVQPGMNHMAFEIDTFEQLKASIHEIKQRNLRLIAARHHGPGESIRVYFLDPEGNQIELYWNLDQIGWDGRSRKWLPVEDIDLENYDLESFLQFKSQSVVQAVS